MAEINPPSWQQDGGYTAQMDRIAAMAMMMPNPPASAWAPMAGVRPSPNNPLKVSAQSSPNMSVSVYTGTAFVGASIALNAGWVCSNNEPRTVTIAAADSSHPRIDLIIAHVYDATDDIGPTSEWILEPVQGTPGVSPAPPARPANSVVLAEVTVRAGTSQILNTDITDLRTWTVALGGLWPTTSGNLAASPYPGLPVWCEDTGQALVFQGPDSPVPHSWQSIATGFGPWQSTQSGSIPWSPQDSAWRPVSSGAWAPCNFTVPPSGSVYVTVTATLANASAISALGWKINDPAVGDTGGNYRPFSVSTAVEVGSAGRVRSSVRTLVTGLTTGKALRAYAGWQATGGSPGDGGDGTLLVEAVL